MTYNFACVTKNRCCQGFSAVKEQVCCLAHQSMHTLNGGVWGFTFGRYEPIPLAKCASCTLHGLCSLNRLLLDYGRTLVCETVLWWGSAFMRWDNQLPQHPCMVPHKSSQLNCRQLPASLLCECVVCSYQLPGNWAICSWRMFSIRSPPAFLPEWATTLFEKCSCPGHIKHGIVKWRYSTSCQLTSHSVLELVLSELSCWLCSST
jgi:hypothetical protein